MAGYQLWVGRHDIDILVADKDLLSFLVNLAKSASSHEYSPLANGSDSVPKCNFGGGLRAIVLATD